MKNALVHEIDLAGNVSGNTAFSFTVDTTAPSAPTGLDLAAADDTGASSTDNITKNTSALTISGSGENGATVTLFDDANNNGMQDGGEATLGTATVTGGTFTTDISLAWPAPRQGVPDRSRRQRQHGLGRSGHHRRYDWACARSNQRNHRLGQQALPQWHGRSE